MGPHERYREPTARIGPIHYLAIGHDIERDKVRDDRGDGEEREAGGQLDEQVVVAEGVERPPLHGLDEHPVHVVERSRRSVVAVLRLVVLVAAERNKINRNTKSYY